MQYVIEIKTQHGNVLRKLETDASPQEIEAALWDKVTEARVTADDHRWSLERMMEEWREDRRNER